MAPLLIFPWFFVPSFWKLIFQKSTRQMSEGLKFSLAWFFPVFIAFSLISGKQVHYLLPIYPALALMIASEFDRIKKITWFGIMNWLCDMELTNKKVKMPEKLTINFY